MPESAQRVLEARFHPFEDKSPTFVVVGHLVWRDDVASPEIQPSPTLDRQTAPGTMLATIRHFVAMTSPRSFEGLQILRNRFWSFKAVAAPGGRMP
jgi:hypothetical protein